MSIESPILPTFLPVEIELNFKSVIRVRIHFYSGPPGINTLIYHLMDLFISYLTLYNQPNGIQLSENFQYIVIHKRNSGRQ